MQNLKDISRLRLTGGILLVVAGLLCNEWLLAALLSSDGLLELGSCLAIRAFELVLLAVGLLALFAGRSLIVGLSVFVAVGLISLLAVDLVARSALKEMLYYSPEMTYKNRRPEMPSHSLFESNVHYVGNACGDLAAMTIVDSFRDVRQVVFDTDDYGYRNDTGAADRVLDLILLGDSFGSGAGTSQEDTWAVLWQEKYGLNTYCLSMPGYSPWHQLILLKSELPRLKIDSSTVVLWAIFCGNDLDEPYLSYLEPKEPNGFFARLSVSLHTWSRRSPIRQLANRVLAAIEQRPPTDSAMIRTLPDGRSILFSSSYVAAQARSLEDIRQHPNLPKLAAVFGEMKRYTDGLGIKVEIVLIPTKGMVYDWVLHGGEPWEDVEYTNDYAVVIGELCQEIGFPFLDLQPSLIGRARLVYDDSRRLLWWRDDSHWNDHGHAAAAELVADWLSGSRDTSSSTF